MSRKLKPQIRERAPKRIRQSRAVRPCGLGVVAAGARRLVTVLMEVTMKH
jgi:hypothetical protein